MAAVSVRFLKYSSWIRYLKCYKIHQNKFCFRIISNLITDIYFKLECYYFWYEWFLKWEINNNALSYAINEFLIYQRSNGIIIVPLYKINLLKLSYSYLYRSTYLLIRFLQAWKKILRFLSQGSNVLSTICWVLYQSSSISTHTHTRAQDHRSMHAKSQ